jgi:hypothetical protein
MRPALHLSICMLRNGLAASRVDRASLVYGLADEEQVADVKKSNRASMVLKMNQNACCTADAE